MRIFVISFCFLLFFGLNSEAQKFEIYKGDTINVTDGRSLKQGLWVSFYQNAEKKSEITYKNGVKKGYAKIFFENGNVAEEGTWHVDKWVGKYRSYYKNGKLNYSWNYNNKGTRSGYQRYYYENGNVKIEGEWEEGREKGIIKDYYENGSIRSEKKYSNGIIDSSEIKTYKIKEIVNTEIHKKEPEKIEKISDDLKIFKGTGHHVFYTAQKKVEKEGEFIKGNLINGKHHIYDKNGELFKTIIYENGKVVKQVYYRKSE